MGCWRRYGVAPRARTNPGISSWRSTRRKSWTPETIAFDCFGSFARRSLRGRPAIDLRVHKATAAAWALFRGHHYLTARPHRPVLGGHPGGRAGRLHELHAAGPAV